MFAVRPRPDWWDGFRCRWRWRQHSEFSWTKFYEEQILSRIAAALSITYTPRLGLRAINEFVAEASYINDVARIRRNRLNLAAQPAYELVDHVGVKLGKAVAANCLAA